MNNINEYTDSLIALKRESIREATVEELQKAAAQYAGKVDKVNKGLDKVSGIAAKLKSKIINKESANGSEIGKKIALSAGVTGAAMVGAGIAAKKIADKRNVVNNTEDDTREDE